MEKDEIKIKAKKVWNGIKSRCGKHPAYLHTTISKDWEDFDNFLSWFEIQVYNGWYEQGWEIDKDIIGRGSNKYSSELCAFIPKPLNNLFTKAFNRRSRGIHGTRGVKTVLSTSGEGYDYDVFCSQFSYDGKVIFYGEYDYELFAFFEYKFAFEEFVQNKAKELQDKISPLMYDALMSYRVLPSGD